MRFLVVAVPLLVLACDDTEALRASVQPAAGASGAAAAGAPAGGGAGAGGAKAGAGGAGGAGAGGVGQAGFGHIGAGHGGVGGAGAGGAGAGEGGAGGAAVCGEDPVLPEQKLTGGPDPTKGKFTMEQALEGLPEGPGPLRAIVATDKGELSCELRPDVAPVAVANFVGLARGTRPSKDKKSPKWVKRRFYDGLTFHRVIPGFVAQGGDPLGNGLGNAGYSFADEITELKHVAGALAYASSGPNTNGSQFYVTEEAQPSLDGIYTVFGVCTPVSVVTELTGVPRDADDKPLTPLLIQSIKITRCAP